jgi:2-keto-4-pentenoate hydratase/2-oxohepta-3-ene-1,7-dioic acid hydratase in catechol pathway
MGNCIARSECYHCIINRSAKPADRFFVMEPGDVITTGTPPGVALGMKPDPVWLKAGDVVTLGIQGLGEQKQKIVKFRM